MANAQAICVLTLSHDQVKRALGQGSYEKRGQSSGSDENDKGSRGHGKKDAVRAKAKARKDPEASLQVQKVGVPLQLRLSYTN